MADLRRIAIKLGTEGPFKTLPSPRLIQLLFNGVYIARTTHARYVWEHPFYPQWYLPKTELLDSSRKQLRIHEGDTFRTDDGKPIGTQWTIQVGDKSTDNVVAFSDELTGKAEPLRGLVKIDFASMDQWLEEDTPIYVHPKDPFKRIDCLHSQRPIQISLAGHLIASSPTSTHLYETGLPCRYYLPLTSIHDPSLLRRSPTRTQCPYKGEAEYYSVEIDGRTHEDVVWFYTRPTLECGSIAGLVCFYNEKVDVVLDGEELERPETHFGKGGPNSKPSIL